MSYQNYPEECNFCTKKFKISSCVLPYALAKHFPLPTDSTDRITELTELHCFFSNDYYRQAVDQTRWRTTTSDSHSGSAPSHTKQWLSELNPEFQTSQMSEIATIETQSTSAEGAPLALASTTSPVLEDAADSRPDPSSKNDTSDPHLEEKDPLTHSDKSPLTRCNLRQHTTELTHKEPTPALSTNEILHLVEDIAIAATCAQTLRKVRRDKTQLIDLLEPLTKEMDIATDKSKLYVPHTSTKLDHPVALARELTSRHTLKQMSQWLDSTLPVEHSHNCGCILNYKPFSLTLGDTVTQKRLDNSLLQFSRNATEMLLKNGKHKKQASTALKALLEERKMNSTFEWLTNSPLDKLFIDDPNLLKLEREKRATKPTRNTKDPTLFRISDPPIPPNTAKTIEKSLLASVNTELVKDNSPSKELNDKIRIPNILFLITHQVIRYNPKWEQPHFSVSLTMINQATSSLDFNYTTIEKLHLMYTVTNVLNTLRDSQTKT